MYVAVGDIKKVLIFELNLEGSIDFSQVNRERKGALA